MEEKLIKFIQENGLFGPEDHILLALSGGVDSVVLLYILKKMNFHVSAAHCNFQLRGKESDDDMRFAEDLTSDLGVKCYSKKFKTYEYASKNGLSIQIAARELRYEWFEELANTLKTNHIVTAHHLNDSLETTFFNLVKGTGISGLAGIPVKNGKVVRPLLFTSKKEVLKYAEANNLKWREDFSNRDSKYHRNLIRNEIVPKFRLINHGLEETFRNTSKKLKQTESVFREYIDLKKKEVLKREGQSFQIDKKGLLSFVEPVILLFEIIEAYGFNYKQAENIVSGIEQSGLMFYSTEFQLNVDREFLIIQEKQTTEFESVEIAELKTDIEIPNGKLESEIIDSVGYKIERDPKVAALDYEKIEFPLTIRKWKNGDQFVPLGMKNSKKVSDFLIDSKVSNTQKQKTLVIESNGKIIWLVGHRISDLLRIGSNTKTVLRMKLTDF